MAPLAGMLRERGFRVTGSDSGAYPPASTLLENLGISFFNTFDAAHLQPAPDLVVIGNIIARGNPELEEVLDRKISYRSMPEILEEVFLPKDIPLLSAERMAKPLRRRCWLGFSTPRASGRIFLWGAWRKTLERVTGLAAGKSSFLKVTSMKRRSGTADPSFFTIIR